MFVVAMMVAPSTEAWLPYDRDALSTRIVGVGFGLSTADNESWAKQTSLADLRVFGSLAVTHPLYYCSTLEPLRAVCSTALLFTPYTHDCTISLQENSTVKCAHNIIIRRIINNDESSYWEEINNPEWRTEDKLLLASKTKDLTVDFRSKRRHRHIHLYTSVELEWSRWTFNISTKYHWWG